MPGINHLARVQKAHRIAARLAIADSVFEPVFERAEDELKAAQVADQNRPQARALAALEADHD